MNPWNNDQTSMATSRRAATTIDASHRSGQKLMMEARFAQVQPQILIFASPFHFGCMDVRIEELLGSVTTTMMNSSEGFQSAATTSSRMVVAFHQQL